MATDIRHSHHQDSAKKYPYLKVIAENIILCVVSSM